MYYELHGSTGNIYGGCAKLFFLDYATGPGTVLCPLTLLVAYFSPLDDIA